MCDTKFPFEILDVETELNTELMRCYTGEQTGFVRVGPKGYFFPDGYKKEAMDIYSLPVRSDDVYIITYPRSGTTWTQELIWLVKNDLDYEGAKTNLDERFPFLEISMLLHPKVHQTMLNKNKHDPQKLELFYKFISKRCAQKIADSPSPRFIKTHMPISLLPPGLHNTAKVVYIARDPRDAAVSFYHFRRLIIPLGADCDFKTFWDYFTRDLQVWSPYFEHVKEAWMLRHHPNVLFLFYEDLQKDLASVIRRVAEFFHKKYTEEQINTLCDHLAFDNFKHNPAINSVITGIEGFFNPTEQSFVRKGKSGGWRDLFDAEMTSQAEQWMRDNLGNTDLRFPSFKME